MKHINKLLLLFAFVLSAWQAKAQTTGSVCTSAAPIGSQNTFHSFTSATATDEWLSFTAPDTGFYHRYYIKVFISGMSSSPNYSLTLYNGSCPTKTLVTDGSNVTQGDTMYYYSEWSPKDTTYQVHIENDNTSPTTFSMQVLYMVDATQASCFSHTYTPPPPSCELVYNGSFDIYNGVGIGAVGAGNAKGWFCPNNTTPDSYNTGYSGGSAGPGSGVPPCVWQGYQNTHSGAGYVGIVTSSATKVYNEYVETKLLSPMQAGKIYQISFYVSKAEFEYYDNYSLSIYLENNMICEPNSSGPLSSVSPKFTVGSTDLNDCTNWRKISKNYCALGGEQYLAIGSPDPHAGSYNPCSTGTPTNCTASMQNAGNGFNAYLFIDDVSVQTSTFSVTSPSVACIGTTFSYSIASTCTVDVNSNFNYNWTFGDGNTDITTSSPESHVFTTAGTYSGNVIYSLSSSPSCSVSLPFTTTVKPALSSMILLNSSSQVCDGASSILSALTTPSTGNYTYSWSPGGATTSSIAVTPTGTVVYTLTVYDVDCGITKTATTTVTGGNTPHPSITASIPACPATTNTLTASGVSTYTWSPGGATTASITATPTVGTVYSVQSSTNGCTGTATVLVAPVVCCTCGNAINETSSTTTYTAGNYYLNHTFTVTSNYALSNMTILMGSNAEIVVANGVKLDLVTTHLLGCNTMWKGIRYVGSQGTITTSKNVLIEDAVTAIDLSPVTAPSGTNTLIIDAQDVTFNKNRTGISIGTYTNSGYYPSNFKSAVFTCRRLITTAHSACLGLSPVNYTWTNTGNQALKTTSYTPSNSNISTGSNVRVTDDFSASTYSTTNLEVPYQNTFSQYGIYLNGTGLTNTVTLQGFRIGNSGTDFTTLNLFDNLCYGIYATQANVTSQNSAYQYMRQNSTTKYHSLPMYSGGVGIYAENNQTTGTNYAAALNVLPVSTGSFSPTGNFFFNNPYGIVTANMQYVDIEYAMIHSKRTSTTFTTAAVPPGEYGIYMKNFDYRNINVLNNVAANVGVGVSFYGAYFTKPKTATQYAGAVSISTNTLQANYPGGSLTSRALKLGIVADNAVNCYSCTISGSTSSNILINSNKILNAYSGITSSNWANQITTTGSNSVTLVDNGVSSAQQFGIQHVNNYADIVTTNTVTGFNTTKIPVQAIRADFNYNQQMTCNYTSNTYDGFYFTGAANLTHWMGNNMTTHKRGMTLWNSAIGQQGASGSPIYNSWNGTWTGNFQTWVQGPDPGNTSSQMYFLSSQLPTSNGAIPASNNYKTTGTPVSLFTTTGVSPSCITTGTVVNGHHHLLAFRSNLISMAANSYSYVPYMSGNDQNGLYSVYREIIEDTSLMAGNSALKSLYTDGNSGIYNHFNLAENDLFNLSDSLAQIQVNAMSPTTTVETNTQNFYNLYLKLRNNSYDSTDDSTLLALANACPSKDGRVVYQARVLYNAAHDFSQQFYNACDTVTVGKPGHNDLTNSQVNANFIVYPNPNNGNLFLSADNIGLSSYTVRVFDITGNIVMEREYNEGGVKSLSIGAESGIYMVEVVDTQLKTTYRQKIVIQK